MIYLDLVNSVLRRLREATVTAVNENDYSIMVGDFVNDAKATVEQAHDWSVLETTFAFDTQKDVATYELPSSGQDCKIFNAYNGTSDTVLEYKTRDYFNNRTYIQNTQLIEAKGGSLGSPAYYTFNGVANGNTRVKVGPMPDGVYSLYFVGTKRQADLTNNTDALLVPSRPVIHLALGLLARERGETGGTSAAEYFAIANNYLSDAIALDANKRPEEMIFRTV